MIKLVSRSQRMFSTKPVKLPFLVFGNVLFPNAKQVIKVEEPKYLVMMSDVASKNGGMFGCVKSLKTAEDALKTNWNGEETGTIAKVLNVKKDKKKFVVEVLGTHKFNILSKNRTLFGYFEGEVESLEEKEVEEERVKSVELAIQAKKLFDECYENVQDFKSIPPKSLMDPNEEKLDLASFSYQLAELLPATQKKKQEMLSSKTTSQRLELQTLYLKDLLVNKSKRI